MSLEHLHNMAGLAVWQYMARFPKLQHGGKMVPLPEVSRAPWLVLWRLQCPGCSAHLQRWPVHQRTALSQSSAEPHKPCRPWVTLQPG